MVRVCLIVAVSVSWWRGNLCWSSHLLVIISAPASARMLTYTISGNDDPLAAHLQVLALCQLHAVVRGAIH